MSILSDSRAAGLKLIASNEEKIKNLQETNKQLKQALNEIYREFVTEFFTDKYEDKVVFIKCKNDGYKSTKFLKCKFNKVKCCTYDRRFDYACEFSIIEGFDNSLKIYAKNGNYNIEETKIEFPICDSHMCGNEPYFYWSDYPSFITEGEYNKQKAELDKKIELMKTAIVKDYNGNDLKAGIKVNYIPKYCTHIEVGTIAFVSDSAVYIEGQDKLFKLSTGIVTAIV